MSFSINLFDLIFKPHFGRFKENVPKIRRKFRPKVITFKSLFLILSDTFQIFGPALFQAIDFVFPRTEISVSL